MVCMFYSKWIDTSLMLCFYWYDLLWKNTMITSTTHLVCGWYVIWYLVFWLLWFVSFLHYVVDVDSMAGEKECHLCLISPIICPWSICCNYESVRAMWYVFDVTCFERIRRAESQLIWYVVYMITVVKLFLCRTYVVDGHTLGLSFV